MTIEDKIKAKLKSNETHPSERSILMNILHEINIDKGDGEATDEICINILNKFMKFFDYTLEYLPENDKVRRPTFEFQHSVVKNLFL
jgi:hypothetical protein